MKSPHISDMTINSKASLKEALEVIDCNAQGTVFVVDDNNKLLGVLTDGDIRRALLREFPLSAGISKFMKKDCVSSSVREDISTITTLLSSKVKIIPLVDHNLKVVDYASLNRLHGIQVAEPSLVGNELEYVVDCVKNNWISSQGNYVSRFEEMFADYHDRYALAVCNGTVALHLALLSLDIGSGDEVIVPNFTFAASMNSIIYTGARPVLIDIEPDTWTIDTEKIESVITSRTKAIMPVHIYGQPCCMDKIIALAKKYNLLLVEDSAEALGSSYNNKKVGTFGDVSAFSFFGNKTITTGEGGMILFKEESQYEKAKVLRDHGMMKNKRYWHEVVGYNYRMTNLQAAIGVAQFERIFEIVESKIKLGELYATHLSNISYIETPFVRENVVNSYWLYSIKLSDKSYVSRDELMDKLLMNGIETRPVFYPLHLMPPYKSCGINNSYPISEDVSKRALSLPSSVSLVEEDIFRVVERIKLIFNMRNLLNDVDNTFKQNMDLNI